MTTNRYPITREYAAKIASMTDEEIHKHRYDLLRYEAAPQPFSECDPDNHYDWWTSEDADICADYCTKVLMDREGKTGKEYEWIYNQEEHGIYWDYLNKQQTAEGKEKEMENIKTVSMDDVREEFDRVNENLKDTLVEVSVYRNSNGIVVAKVNWATIGSVTYDEALAFAETVTKASELAKAFKYNGCKAVYR